VTDLTIFGSRAEFIPHNGCAKLPSPIDLPSRTRVSHCPTTQIQELVAVSYGLHPRCMTAAWRGPKHVSWTRQIAMYLTREITHRSLPSIARSFNRKDHSTVIHAIRVVERRMKENFLIRADVKALREALTK
jgi:chromosomal replication initiator protein